MFVDLAPRWNTGLIDESHDPRVFDSPKCMLRWSAEGGGARGRDAWVVEYYAQTRRPLAETVLVVGSDLIGPMGPDLVPVAAGERAAQFIHDHGGRIVTPGDVSAELLREIDAP